MNIITIDYSMATQSLDIFFSGCAMGQHCPGCHNSEAWDFNVGSDWMTWIDKIKYNVEHFNGMIKRIFILGGEPLDQDRTEFIKFMDTMFSIILHTDIEQWLFTRYEMDQIPEEIKDMFDYIKTGPYKEELTVDNNIQYSVKLATSNQKIWKSGVDF